MSKGKVQEYSSARGSGIIVDVETGQEFIVYANYVYLKSVEELKQGQEVEFEIENRRGDVWAINVRIV